jgi:predicted acetyltransferase
MEIDLEVVDVASLPTLAALAQLYQYDFSEIEGGVTGLDGRFSYLDDLEDRLVVPDATAWLFRLIDPQFHVETLAGFALVLPVTDGSANWAIDEFFVLRKYRRLGVGRAAATAIVKSAPGTWVVQGTRNNVNARMFWDKVVEEVAFGTPTRAENDAVTYPAWTFHFHVE